MGFSLESMFEKLFEILNQDDQKAAKTVKELKKEIEWQHEYAKECGQLK